MKKLGLCCLLLIGLPSFARMTAGLEVGLIGGVETIMSGNDSENGTESKVSPAFGVIADCSMPVIPLAIRGGFEYSWKSSNEPFFGLQTESVEATFSELLILLAVQWSVSLPVLPASFYLGTGGEVAMWKFSVSESYMTETDVGLLGYAGLNYKLGGLSIFAEGGFGVIFSETPIYSVEEYLHGDLRTWPDLKHVPIRGGIKIEM